MGFRVERRPIRTPGLAVGVSTSPGSVADDVALAGALKLPNQSLTSTAALQTLSADGVSFLTVSTGTGGRDFRLPVPPRAGAVKVIFADISGTTQPNVARVLTNTTAQTFWGTTYNEVSLSSTGTTAQTAGTPYLLLVAKDTTSWAVGVGSTKVWDFAKTTGSTGQ